MDRLTAVQVFVETVDRGSLTAAADALGMSRAMATRYLEALEHWLGARLLHRTTRRLSLSDAGEQVLPSCREMLSLGDTVQALSGAVQVEAVGRLRITASLSLAESHLTRALVDFQMQHPRIELELLALDRAVDLVEERIDLALRISAQLDPTLRSRRLATCHSMLCASPGYLRAHAAPQTPQDLAQHRLLAHTGAAHAQWRLTREGQDLTLPVNARLRSNETAVVRAAALCDAGIAMLPTYYIGDDVRAGRLVPLLSDWTLGPLDIHAVYLSRRHQPKPLRLLIDWLAERWQGPVAPWDAALQA